MSLYRNNIFRSLWMLKKTDIILKVNHKKVSCKNELEKYKVNNSTIEFTHYDFEHKESKEKIKGWSCSVKF